MSDDPTARPDGLPPLDPGEEETARRSLSALTGQVVLQLDPGPDPGDKFSEVLCDFCRY